jgi:Uma2 family endonuclease
MTVALRKSMSREEFFAWAESQEERFEFDGFQPVAMTGGNLRHSRLIRNINRQLGNRLSGTPCESLGSDAGVATVGDTVRYPDAVVTCSPIIDRELLVPNPVIVFEVVSPSSVRRDRVTKLREYQAVASIVRYVIVEPDEIAITVLFRDDGTDMFRAAGLGEGDSLQLPEIGIEIPLADIYQGVAIEGQTATTLAARRHEAPD